MLCCKSCMEFPFSQEITNYIYFNLIHINSCLTRETYRGFPPQSSRNSFYKFGLTWLRYWAVLMQRNTAWRTHSQQLPHPSSSPSSCLPLLSSSLYVWLLYYSLGMEHENCAPHFPPSSNLYPTIMTATLRHIHPRHTISLVSH
jgi:hypothetical protein